MRRPELATAGPLLAILAVLLPAARAGAACDASICGPTPCTITGTHDVDAGCTLDFSGKDVTLASGATLQNLGGSGGFTIRATSLAVRGTIRFPNGGVTIDVEDDFSMPTATSVIDTATTAVGGAGNVEITAGGTVTVNRVITTGADYGGWVQLYGKNVLVPGNVLATAPETGGDVWIEADEDVTIAGTVNASATGSALGDAGGIGIECGDEVRVLSSGTLRAVGVNGGGGGTIWVLAQGAGTADGVIAADGTGTDAVGGDVSFDAATITTAGDWSANGGSGPGASGGAITISASVGTLVTANTAAMDVVSAGSAGEIWLESMGNQTVAGDLSATASGTDSYGGRIGLWAYGSSAITVAAAASFDVTSSAATGVDGQIQLGACDVTVSGQLKANAHADGQNLVFYRGSFTVTSSGRLIAGATGRNLIQCRCAGGDPNALPFPGTCPPSPACATPPVTQGSAVVTPAFAFQPIPLHPCGCFDGVRNGTETDVDCGGGTCADCFDGKTCASAADCVSGVCTAGVCTTACTDGVKNGDESDVDCGGQCAGCAEGKKCRNDFDCAEKSCDFQASLTCQPPTCTDRHQNGAESDKNCGGGTCPPCADGQKCKAGPDCTSKVCHPTTLLCLAPTCTDGTQNDVETDADCGGGVCPPCDDGKACGAKTDCRSKVCNPATKTCDPPSCTDGETNGTETDLGCGGGACPACADGKVCLVDSDCTSKVCDPTADPSVKRCAAPTCTDRAANGTETGTNCGGGTCPACPDGEPCGTDADCLNQVCANGTCTEPDCTDLRRNEQETDVDCGGPECGDCADGKICKVDEDCTSRVCDPSAVPGVKRCAVPTCTDRARNGAETDVNCGGPCPPCDDLLECKLPADCKSKVCGPTSDPAVMRCAVPTCGDTVENGAETDQDCGGPTCGDCADGRKCKAGDDCVSKVCNLTADPNQPRCATPTCTDGALNGKETGTDCGGGACGKCKTGEGCSIGSRDCESGVCGILWWACRYNPNAPAPCYGWCRDPSCEDFVQNGQETDVGCGGPVCPPCEAGKKCGGDGDCRPGLVCDAGTRTCRASCPDGVRNGRETGVDCGGGSCPPCGFDQGCTGPGDCVSNVCSGGACRCPDHTFTFDIESTDGGAVHPNQARWQGGQLDQSQPGGCSVSVNAPSGSIDLVCGVVGADNFTLAGQTGYSSCAGKLGAVQCMQHSFPSSCGDRPSCSSALNGKAAAQWIVECTQ